MKLARTAMLNFRIIRKSCKLFTTTQATCLPNLFLQRVVSIEEEKKQLEMLKVKTTDADGRKVMNIHHMNQIYKNINTCKLDRFSPIYTDTHVMTMWNE